MRNQYWLCYGGGVNSTALAILLVQGKLPQYEPWTAIFADTGNEKEETYRYLGIFRQWMWDHGHEIITVSGPKSVLQMWQDAKIIGDRRTRSCTDHAKIRPIKKYIKEHGGGIRLVAIDAGEPDRAKEAKDQIYPLISIGIDREDCIGIIRDAGLPIPIKSGCWHCPFLRVQDILDLAIRHPRKLDIIERLEQEASIKAGKPRFQWGNKPVSYWRERAKTGQIYVDDWEICTPCECYDG